RLPPRPHPFPYTTPFRSVAAMFACAKLGAIFIPIFSGYGADAVATRLQDADAKALLTADGFSRRGSVVNMKAIADDAVASSPSVDRKSTRLNSSHGSTAY